MKALRKIIEIDEERCDGCGQCIVACAEGALKMIDGKARVISDKFCDGLGACMGQCPQDALRIVEREAEEFDEEAVMEMLANKNQAEDHSEMARGCASTTIQDFTPSQTACQAANTPRQMGNMESALKHWPVQIRLVPANAGFLENAHLLVLADCSAVAFPALHRDLLDGKVVLMGCPKFDDVEMYVQKFADIFKTANIQSVTTVIMEVPCCAGMPMIVKKGLDAAKKQIDLKEITIGVKGDILESKHEILSGR